MGNKSFSWFLSLSSKTENRLWHLWDKHWQETVLVFEFFFFIFVFICMSSCQPVFGPPVTPSVLLSKHFLGVVSLVFSQIWHGARNSYKVVHNRAFREKKNFLSQNWEKGPKMGQNQGFFNILENLVINLYWIWSWMEIYIIGSVPTQIPYLGKFLFLRYGPKCSHPIRLQYFLINHISRTN